MVIGAILLDGCVGTTPDQGLGMKAPVMRIFVLDTSGAHSPETASLGDIIHDTAVRTLRSQGYEVAMELAQADAALRTSWHARPGKVGSPTERVYLQMSLTSLDGRIIRSTEVINGMPAGFLTKSKVADLVHAKLREFGPAPLAR